MSMRSMGAQVYTARKSAHYPCYDGRHHEYRSSAAARRFGQGGVEAGWRVRRSRQARRPSVRLYRDGAVEIVVPERLAPQQIESFVAKHRGWIDRHRCSRPIWFSARAAQAQALGGLAVPVVGAAGRIRGRASHLNTLTAHRAESWAESGCQHRQRARRAAGLARRRAAVMFEPR